MSKIDNMNTTSNLNPFVQGKKSLISAIRKLSHDNAFDCQNYEKLIEKVIPSISKEMEQEFPDVMVNGELWHPFDSLLKDLQATPILDCGDFIENLPSGIYLEHFQDESKWRIEAGGLNQDKHRWYELVDTVYKIYGRYLCVRSVGHTYRESMIIEDVGYYHEFKEVKKIPVVKYKYE